MSELLSAAFGRPLALDNHPKHDVALGAAIRDTPAAKPAAAASPPARPADLSAGTVGVDRARAPRQRADAAARRQPPSRSRRPSGHDRAGRMAATGEPEAAGRAVAGLASARSRRPDARRAETMDRRPRGDAASTTSATDTVGAHRHPAHDRLSGAVIVTSLSGETGAPRGGRVDRRPPAVRPGERQPGRAAGVRDPPW